MSLLAVTLEAFTEPGFWISVGVIADIYTIVALGLQLNVGFTGIVNFGQAAFMAIGAYTMAILVLKVGISFWLSLPLAILVTVGFGLLIGLPSLRLRADYFAIATIALAEVLRIFAQNTGVWRRRPEHAALDEEAAERAHADGGQPGAVLRGGQRLELLSRRLARRLGLDQRIRGQLLERP